MSTWVDPDAATAAAVPAGPTPPGSAAPDALLALFARFHPGEPTALVEAAYALAEAAHAGQLRASGEPYFTHPVAVAEVVASFGLDAVSVAAALCHDVIEDTAVSRAELGARLGPEVAALVEGVTKLDRSSSAAAAPLSKGEVAAGTLRKLLVTASDDLRVLLVKLADRLHNMRTIAALPRVKQERIALETLEVYAPLAHRLGMHELKTELEELAFAAAYPDRHAEVASLVAKHAPARDTYLGAALAEARHALAAAGVEAQVTGRAKALWSVYAKMTLRGVPFEAINDLVGIRVIVDAGVEDCYRALGVLHLAWPPVPGQVHDYIAQPKWNSYQSLHTTLVGPGGRVVEAQIRTRGMHTRAEHGIAAHWAYKEHLAPGRSPGVPADAAERAWVSELARWAESEADPERFLSELRSEVGSDDEVLALTPAGDVVALPTGATLLDFAYAIHTEVGNRAVGAKVNGRLAPLGEVVRAGDTVEVLTSDTQSTPRPEWLAEVTTTRARAAIRAALLRARRSDEVDAGLEELTAALHQAGLPPLPPRDSAVVAAAARTVGFGSVEQLAAAIARGRVRTAVVVAAVRSYLQDRAATTGRDPHLPATAAQAALGAPLPPLSVEGLDDVLVQRASCCNPVPGDHLVGYLRGRKVTAHRAGCAAPAGTGRLVDVEWTRGAPLPPVTVEVQALDRPRLLAEVAAVLSDHGANVVACLTQTAPDQVARQRFDFTLADPATLDRLLAAVGALDGVFGVRRLPATL